MLVLSRYTNLRTAWEELELDAVPWTFQLASRGETRQAPTQSAIQ